jgi:hypothetical protein
MICEHSLSFTTPQTVARKYRLTIGAALVALALSGCTSDGDDSSTAPTTNPTTPTATTTTLTGTVVAGPVNGQACAYKLSDAGAIGDLLACATTAANSGAYSLSFSNYAGQVLMKAFGTYTDEATGQARSILESSPLRAVVACATSGVDCRSAVTPLTEAALRSAGTLTRANIDAAYLKIAQAYGLNPSNAADAVTKLVDTLPVLGSRTDAAVTKYTDVLALASQAQKRYCGTGNSCTLDNYLDGVRSLLGGADGINSLQSEMNAAMAEWSTNPLNTSGITCSLNVGVVTCNLPSGGTGSGTTGASGNYRLDVTVSANGIPTPAIVINNVPKPDSESAFCSAKEILDTQNQLKANGGTLTVNSCSFSGTKGSISLTLTLTTPIAMTLPYTVSYAYTPM